MKKSLLGLSLITSILPVPTIIACGANSITPKSKQEFKDSNEYKKIKNGFDKYESLKDIINFDGSLVKINQYDYITDTTPVSKIYEVKEDEENLGQLMSDYKNDFGLEQHQSLGLMVKSIFGVLADSTTKTYWQLASPTYVIEDPSSKSTFVGPTSAVNALQIGVSGILLKNSQVINFYKTGY